MGEGSSSFLKKSILPLSFISSSNNKVRISFIVYGVLAVIVFDTAFNQNAQFRMHLSNLGLDIELFIVMGVIALVGQFCILEFVRQKSSHIRKRVAELEYSYKIASLAQYLVIAVFVFVLVEITTIKQYPTISLIIVTMITLRESKFLDSMGTAQIDKELMKRMVLKAREEQKERTQESGVVASLGEEDIINIVKETEKNVRDKDK
jgi:hypothetical protein